MERTPYWSFLKHALKHPQVAYVLGRSAVEHRAVEKEFRRRALDASTSEMTLEFPHLDLPPATYWQRNFFSILFLSIFDSLGVPSERRRLYGLVVHAVRGIVTATDNILDGEDKGAVKLRLDGGLVLPNVLLVLLQDGILGDVLAEVAPDEATRRRASTALLGALFEIAREESSEEGAVEIVLPPEAVLRDIHSRRGGRLLQLAFVAPEITEPELGGSIRRAGEAVGRIGIALQMLDDLTDLREDITRRNHNILRSWIVHRAPDGPTTDDALRKLSDAGLDAPEESFPNATRDVLTAAVGFALQGFDELSKLGHTIDRAAALDLVAMMFHLRGLKRLWSLYDSEATFPADLMTLM